MILQQIQQGFLNAYNRSFHDPDSISMSTSMKSMLYEEIRTFINRPYGGYRVSLDGTTVAMPNPLPPLTHVLNQVTGRMVVVQEDENADGGHVHYHLGNEPGNVTHHLIELTQV